jgi:hypothetical protein
LDELNECIPPAHPYPTCPLALGNANLLSAAGCGVFVYGFGWGVRRIFVFAGVIIGYAHYCCGEFQDIFDIINKI